MATKRKSKILAYILLIVCAIMLISSYFIYQYFKQQQQIAKAERAMYAAFGVDIPLNYSIHGIDVSSHQLYIHWPAVKQMNKANIKIGFAFIKATEGLNDADKNFKSNWQTAKQDSIVSGAYHFFIATKDGSQQAANFIKQVLLEKGDLPPVVDVEELYGVNPILMKQRLRACLQALEQHYKVKPIIYSYVDFYENNLGKDFDDYPLWIAHYFEKDKPRIKRNWLFWQHSEEGHVNGIVTNVDMNVFNGDSTAFRNALIK